jgi:hypothetical protein
MTLEPMIISPLASEAGGAVIKGPHLVIGDWPASGVATEVAPLHVHHADDEAWHVSWGRSGFGLRMESTLSRQVQPCSSPLGFPIPSAMLVPPRRGSSSSCPPDSMI